LANLVRAALQGKNPVRNKAAHDNISADVGGVIECLHILNDPVGLDVALLRVVPPVGLGGGAGNICRQVDEVGGAGIPDVE
jgi:hypothetical protein